LRHSLARVICLTFAFLMIMDYFFFFQAEDGIRDATVTGVQTCALPILHTSLLLVRRRFLPSGELGRLGSEVCITGNAVRMLLRRSEERRVGKECRSRWGRYH